MPIDLSGMCLEYVRRRLDGGLLGVEFVNRSGAYLTRRGVVSEEVVTCAINSRPNGMKIPFGFTPDELKPGASSAVYRFKFAKTDGGVRVERVV